jgi:ankyrin repeat protein
MTPSIVASKKATPAERIAQAIRDGNAKEVALILEQGFDVNQRNVAGATLLHYACEFNVPHVCEVLIDAGIDIEARSDRLQTALTIAVEWRQASIIALLLDRGADVHAPGESDCNALRVAICEGSRSEAPGEFHAGQCIRMLVERGASIADFSHAQGVDPLHLAVQEQNPPAVQAILSLGYEQSHGLESVRAARDLSMGLDNRSIQSFLTSWIQSRDAMISMESVASSAHLRP